MSTYQMGRGEARTFTLTVASLAGALVDLTGASIYFVVKNLEGTTVLTKRSTAAGGGSSEVEILTQSGGTLGQCKVYITSEDTEALAQTARWADCWVVTAGVPPEELKVDEHSPFYVTGEAPPFS